MLNIKFTAFHSTLLECKSTGIISEDHLPPCSHSSQLSLKNKQNTGDDFWHSVKVRYLRLFFIFMQKKCSLLAGVVMGHEQSFALPILGLELHLNQNRKFSNC